MDVVNDEVWLQARIELLEKEKALTKLRDEVAASRRQMPWRLVEQPYSFTDEKGERSLSDLFGDHSQLVLYHYMFAPGWQEGCRSCSFWADQYDVMMPHLAARDVALAVVSRAPWQDYQVFKQRMGWQFPWLSSDGTRFNQDFHVSFPEQSTGTYNYRETNVMAELPGLSVFTKQTDVTSGEEQIYHTYSVYSRGLDPLNATYQVLDLVPMGRDEAELPFPMHWVQLHDAYGK